MSRIRSKREAEREAYDEQRERERAALLEQMKAPGEGYAHVGLLPLLALEICLRCSAVIYGRERHDAWHAAQLM